MTMTETTPDASTPTGTPDIDIRELRVYRGPNYFSYDQAIHMVVDIGRLEESPTDAMPGFTESLLSLLPGLKDHQCSRGRDGGFVERLTEGTWAGHVVEHVALEIQRTAGHEMTRGKTRSTGEHGVYNVIFGYLDETVGTLAGRLAVRLVNHLVPGNELMGDEFDFRAELDEFLRTSQRVAFGPSTQAILDEAIARDIPWQRLNSGSLVQLGQGVNQRRIRATMTSLTSSLAVDIASDKELTNRLLAAAGLPVPASDVVRRADDAVRVARRIGYPVVAQTPRRQPRSRRGDQPEHRPGGQGRIRGGLRPVAARLRPRRVVHHRPGLPRAGHRRAHGRDRGTGAGARHRRRRGQRRRARGDHQRRSPPRRRAREGAHPHRRHRRRPSTWSALRATRCPTCRAVARW